MSDPQSRYTVFLSHNSRDKDFVELLAYKLKGTGLLPWFDRWELIPGNRWVGGLADGLYTSDTCAVFIGPHNLGSWEAEEIDLAHTRAAQDSSFRVIPVLLPGVPDPFDPNSFPPFLKTRTWVDFRKGPEDQRAFHYLLCGIKGIAPGSELDSDSTEGDQILEQDICPYRGLQVFNEEDAQFYFGRPADVQRLVEKLKVTRFLGVLGASGSGKSSLVRAGLLPRLRAGDLPGSGAWQIVPTFPPGATPLESLVLNFAKLPGADTDGLLGLLRDSERALHAAVSHFLASPAQRAAATQRVLLVVDQLEEVFTLCDNETARAQFLANLLYAGSVPDGGCVVVVTMRADFYHKCAAYPEFTAALAAHQFLVSRMQYDGLVQAIQEPACCVGLTFESGLVETIANDVADQPGALPLLEHALLELWKRRKNGRLTLADYIDAGTAQGAIAKRADAIYDSFSPEEQIVMQRIMLRLTQPGEGTEDTRRRASLGELITRTEDEETVERVVNTLTKPEHRLLTADEETGARMVEVSHEALIRGWDRLRKWLDEDREGLRLHRRLSEAAKEWHEQKRAGTSDDGLLYRGLALARALDWRKQREAELNELERQFLNESEALKQRLEEEQREREQHELETAQRLAAAAQERAALEWKARVRQRYYTFGLAALVVVTSALSVYSYRQYKDSLSREKELRSRELAATATRVLAADPEVSVLLAIEAVKINATAEAELALRESLIHLYGLKSTLRGHTKNVYSAAFSPDGRQVVTASEDETARVWDVATGRTLMELAGHTHFIRSAAFSPDGTQVVTASTDETARVWDVTSGRTVMELTGHTSPVETAAFSPDGRQVVTASTDKTARVWDVATGRAVRVLTGHNDLINSAAFSPDGRQVVTGSRDHTVRVWDVASGRTVLVMTESAPVSSVAFSPDGKQVLTNDYTTARVRDVATGRVMRELTGHTAGVYSAAFSPDGRQVVTASVDKTARVWDVATGRVVRVLTGHTSTIYIAPFSPDGKRVVTAGADRIARVWEVVSERTVMELTGHRDNVIGVAFSPDGRQVVTGSIDDTARVWDVASGRTVMELTGHTYGVRNVAFSPDGKEVVTTSIVNNIARVWDVVTGRMVREQMGDPIILYTEDFSPDGRQVVRTNSDNIARVSDVASGRTVMELTGHSATVHDAVFSPDGRWVVTASDDKTARVWDVASGRTLLELTGHTGPIYRIAFSPDGRQVVTGSADKSARIFDCEEFGSLESLLELAKRRVPRELTEDERTLYLN